MNPVLEVAIAGRATTPITLKFTTVVLGKRARLVVALDIGDKDSPLRKLGGAQYRSLRCEITGGTVGPRGSEPDIHLERMLDVGGYERLGACAAPARLAIAKAVQAAGGFDALFRGAYQSQTVEVVSSIEEQKAQLLAMVAWLDRCAELAEMIETGVAEVVYFERQLCDEVRVKCRSIEHGGRFQTADVAARVMVGYEQVGWINEKGEPVPMRQP